MKNTCFGLDIGSTSIKAVWLVRPKDVYTLNACSSLPTPVKGMTSESPVDQEEIVRSIRSIVEEARITTQYVNVALPENQVYTRVLEMPALSDKELASAIYWEAEQYIPVPLETLSLDWRVLDRPKQGAAVDEKMHVLLVGAPKVLIEKYEKILEMSGLVVNAIETEIIAAIRAIINSLAGNSANVNDQNKNLNSSVPNSLIVNIGAVSTSIAIVKNGTIVFTYSIPAGGNAVNRAIAADFGFTLQQAEEYKKVYGYSSKDFGGKIGKATKPILTSILVEIKKALVFYNEKYKNDNPIKQIILSGGTAKLPGLDLFFAETCGVETVIANPWRLIAGQELPKEIIDAGASYSIAVGLAMRDYE